jgi:hypothetical protein
MPLDATQTKKLESWLSQNAIKGCPMCGGKAITAGDVIAAPQMTPTGMSLGGQSIPMVQLVCDRCAYVMLFSAVRTGLMT